MQGIVGLKFLLRATMLFEAPESCGKSPSPCTPQVSSLLLPYDGTPFPLPAARSSPADEGRLRTDGDAGDVDAGSDSINIFPLPEGNITV